MKVEGGELMGVAKRKRLAPCRCGLGNPAGICCLTSNGWYKKPSMLRLRETSAMGSHASCYLQETNSCDTPSCSVPTYSLRPLALSVRFRSYGAYDSPANHLSGTQLALYLIHS